MKVIRYKGYLGSVDCSIEDDCLHGKILHVNDLITYEADTPQALKKAFEEAVEDYLTTCAAIGKEPDKAHSGSFNVRVGPELHRGAAVAATLQGISLNEWIVKAVAATLESTPEIHHHIHIEATATEKVDFKKLRNDRLSFKTEIANG